MPKSFRDLEVFKRALDLMTEIYEVTSHFPRQEMFGLTSQVRHAAVRVVSDIAEGQGRLSFGEWRQMLSDARGSLFEVEAQMIAAQRLGYLALGTFARVERQIFRVARALIGLIRWVKAREQEHRSSRATAQPRNSSPQ